MRLIATGGIIGIAVILGAVLVAQDFAGWILGLAIGLDVRDLGRASLVLAAALASRPAVLGCERDAVSLSPRAGSRLRPRPCPRLSTSSRPSSASTRSAIPLIPCVARVCAADAVVSDLHEHVAVLDAHSHARGRRLAYAGPSPRSESTAGWMPRASSRSRRALPRAPIASARALQVALSSAKRRCARPERHRRASEPLLRAIVEVALEPRRRGVGGLTSRARDERRSSIRARSCAWQALVLEGEPRAATTPSTSSDVRLSDASWINHATRSPERSTAVATRPEPSAGS